MKVQEQVKRDETNSTEEGLSDLPVPDEAAIKTSGGGDGDEGPEESINFVYGKLNVSYLPK